MRNVKITIEYDGTNYSGWQRQKNSIAIEDIVEGAIRKTLNEDIDIIGSSRTDAGVHARGQVANFVTKTSIPVERLPMVINSKLPLDIRVVNSEEVPLDFHSRYSTTGKLYSYTIFNRRIVSPIVRNYVGHYTYKLDISKMKEAAKYFIGTHDFASFKSTGSSAKTTIRTIRRLDIVECKDNIIKVYIEADGFLYNMVRIIVGTLINVGRGKTSVDSIPDIIKSRNRKMAGQTAPASGLCLEKIYY